jgi:hypothetical protein
LKFFFFKDSDFKNFHRKWNFLKQQKGFETGRAEWKNQGNGMKKLGHCGPLPTLQPEMGTHSNGSTRFISPSPAGLNFEWKSASEQS